MKNPTKSLGDVQRGYRPQALLELYLFLQKSMLLNFSSTLYQVLKLFNHRTPMKKAQRVRPVEAINCFSLQDQLSFEKKSKGSPLEKRFKKSQKQLQNGGGSTKLQIKQEQPQRMEIPALSENMSLLYSQTYSNIDFNTLMNEQSKTQTNLGSESNIEQLPSRSQQRISKYTEQLIRHLIQVIKGQKIQIQQLKSQQSSRLKLSNIEEMLQKKYIRELEKMTLEKYEKQIINNQKLKQINCQLQQRIRQIDLASQQQINQLLGQIEKKQQENKKYLNHINDLIQQNQQLISINSELRIQNYQLGHKVKELSQFQNMSRVQELKKTIKLKSQKPPGQELQTLLEKHKSLASLRSIASVKESYTLEEKISQLQKNIVKDLKTLKKK